MVYWIVFLLHYVHSVNWCKFQNEIQVKMVSTQSDSKFPLPLHSFTKLIMEYTRTGEPHQLYYLKII